MIYPFFNELEVQLLMKKNISTKRSSQRFILGYFSIYEEKGMADDYWIDLLQK